MIDPASLTTSKVNRAGRTLRHYLRDAVGSEDLIREAAEILIAFRSTHQRPLTTANTGLRSMVKTVGCQDPEVSQRLKRIPTILDKLVREPTLSLASMQDLGGCRAVLSNIDEINLVRARIERYRPVVSISDYITIPRSSGYRGVHIIVMYSGRKIEIQLRTQVMHQWAVTVEQLAPVVGNVKTGRGPAEVQKFMEVASRAMALDEQGYVVGVELMREWSAAQKAAGPYLTGGRS